ncbi:MAG: hypothetical protein HYR56_08445 [Acidobacteria bacterium]|nr:hypothetical protein [Acidobacteriota bacterium]MBI3425556.1 hypothetical protein [Acidobacteriota bacterium]
MSLPTLGGGIIYEDALAHLVVGVRDLNVALELWVETFGFELLQRRDGPDHGLAQLWELEPERIRAQVLLGTPGFTTGRLHLVEFAEPLPPVRAGAQPTDLVPKNIDLVCDEIKLRYAELSQAGCRFRSTPARYEAEEDGATLEIFELLMFAHDEVNIAILQLVGRPFPFTPRGFAGFTSLVHVVPDAETETRFFQDVLGFPLHFVHKLDGPHIERMIGLPPGGAVEMRMLGSPRQHAGRIEMAKYHGIDGANLYPLAKPPALGTLHAVLFSPALDEVRQRAQAAGVPVTEHGVVDTLYAHGAALTLHTPAGLRLDIHEIE